MRKAKVFITGGSQAIRIPKEFEFHSSEVAMIKKGGKLILWEIPKNLSDAYHLLTSLPNDCFLEGREDFPPQKRENWIAG